MRGLVCGIRQFKGGRRFLPPGLCKTLYYGLQYDSTHDDYKVSAIVKLAHMMEIKEEDIVAGSVSVCYQVSVYSLKSNSWKRIPTLPCSGSACHLAGSIVSLEDALASLMHNKSDRIPFKILTLKSFQPQVRGVSPTTCQWGWPVYTLQLGGLGRISCFSAVCLYTRSDVWIMKECGRTKSWTLLYSIEEATLSWRICSYKPLVFSKDGDIVLVSQHSKDYYSLFFGYNLETKSVQHVEIDGLPHKFTATVCVGNLCLMDDDPAVL